MDDHRPPASAPALRRPGAALLLLLAPGLLGAQPRSSEAATRFLTRVTTRERVEGLTPAEVPTVNALVRRAADVLAASPVVRVPTARSCTRIHATTPMAWGQRPDVGVGIHTEVPGRGCLPMDNGYIGLHFDRPEALLGQPLAAADGAPLRDAQGTMHVLPEQTGVRRGFAEYGRTLLLTHRREPLAVPVSRERYLQALIAGYRRLAASTAAEVSAQGVAASPRSEFARWRREEKPKLEAEHRRMLADLKGQLPQAELDRMRTTLAESLKETEEAMREAAVLIERERPELLKVGQEGVAFTGSQLRTLEQELAGLSPADRAAPACITTDPDAGVSALAPCTSSNRVVRVNPRFRDPSLPRTASQLLIVKTPAGGPGGTEERQNHALRVRIYESLDVEGLAGLLR